MNNKEKAVCLMSVKYKPEKEQKINEIRTAFAIVAELILNNCKDGREKSLTLTKLEEACMWAIKGITREEEK